MRSGDCMNIIKPANSEFECNENPAFVSKKKEIHWINAKNIGKLE